MSDGPWAAVGLVGTEGHDRFVCTDGVSGWFEGFTRSRTLGGGYRLRDQIVFRQWTSYVDGQPLVREEARSDTVFPWGHRLDYGEGTFEELLLHHGRILSVRVGSGADDLRIEADLNLPPGVTTQRIEERTPGRLTVHWAFGESEAEQSANAARASRPNVFDEEIRQRWTDLTQTWLVTDEEDYNRALFWASASARSLVNREFGPGIWAGLPWFQDHWGRDTFISLPGTLLCSGDFATARAVIETFAQAQNLDPSDQNRGRIPNRVNREGTLYNTVDGTPWLVRELDEYLRHSGDRAFVQGLRPFVRRYVEGALATSVDAEGLLCHDDADTWMDARIEGREPWSPRGTRAVEVQALWIAALEAGQRWAEADGDEAEARFYAHHAKRAREAFARNFVVHGLLVDRLDALGHPDDRLRPNPLMLAWIHRDLAPEALETTIRHLIPRLLLPWGLLSLDPGHPDFHPQHESPGWHKDAAYHNGAIWTWNAGFTVAALCRLGGQDRAWELVQNLTHQLFHTGCLGTLSELVNPRPGPGPVPSGTFSQAWSVSEFVRLAFQEFLGWCPDLPRGELRFRPSLPSSWTAVRARLAYGQDHLLVEVDQRVEGETIHQRWRFQGPPTLPFLVLEIPSSPGPRVRHEIEPGTQSLEVAFPAPTTDVPALAVWSEPPEGWSVEAGSDVLLHRIRKGR